VQRNWNVAVEL